MSWDTIGVIFVWAIFIIPLVYNVVKGIIEWMGDHSGKGDY